MVEAIAVVINTLGQIEGDIQVIIPEAAILLGVEDFQQRCRRITAEMRPNLSTSSSINDGVVHPGAPDGLNNAPRHRPDVRASMPTQLGFIMHATQAHALEGASQGTRNRLP